VGIFFGIFSFGWEYFLTYFFLQFEASRMASGYNSNGEYFLMWVNSCGRIFLAFLSLGLFSTVFFQWGFIPVRFLSLRVFFYGGIF
jgi:hypothetical protein